MELRILYEQWQMECCGTPFSAGDAVQWPVCLPLKSDFPSYIGKIDYIYDAHDINPGGLFLLEGTVSSVRLLYEKYAPKHDDPRTLVPVSGTTFDCTRAEGFEPPRDGMNCSGYIAVLRDCRLRAANSEDIAFR